MTDPPMLRSLVYPLRLIHPTIIDCCPHLLRSYLGWDQVPAKANKGASGTQHSYPGGSAAFDPYTVERTSGAFGRSLPAPPSAIPGVLFGAPLPAKPGNRLMDTRAPRPARPWTDRLRARPTAARADWARRKPRLLFRVSVVFLLRFAERRFLGLLFQEPPRITRRPPRGPFPCGKRYRK